jgi:hypothetical protein
MLDTEDYFLDTSLVEAGSVTDGNWICSSNLVEIVGGGESCAVLLGQKITADFISAAIVSGTTFAFRRLSFLSR